MSDLLDYGLELAEQQGVLVLRRYAIAPGAGWDDSQGATRGDARERTVEHIRLEGVMPSRRIAGLTLLHELGHAEQYRGAWDTFRLLHAGWNMYGDERRLVELDAWVRCARAMRAGGHRVTTEDRRHIRWCLESYEVKQALDIARNL